MCVLFKCDVLTFFSLKIIKNNTDWWYKIKEERELILLSPRPAPLLQYAYLKKTFLLHTETSLFFRERELEIFVVVTRDRQILFLRYFQLRFSIINTTV